MLCDGFAAGLRFGVSVDERRRRVRRLYRVEWRLTLVLLLWLRS